MLHNLKLIAIFVSETRKNKMRQDNISEAISMIENNDWYWRMCDTNFTVNYDAAKCRMRRFVATVSTIEDAVVREALRNLWKLHYENASNAVNGKATENYESRKAELMKALAA